MHVVTTEGTQGWGLILSEGSPVSSSRSHEEYERVSSMGMEPPLSDLSSRDS